jgi:hypothetical protein
MEEELISYIENIISNEIQDQAVEGELAFLSLSSKIEQNFRDRIAVKLQYSDICNQLIIAREYKRCDLAILDINLSPILILEFKACYSFDLVMEKKINEYKLEIEKDFSKSAEKFPGTPMYSILFITHSKNLIPRNLYGVVKYHSQINKNLKLYDNNESRLNDEGKSNFRNTFPQIEYGNIIQNDIAFDISVDLVYGLIKKR